MVVLIDKKTERERETGRNSKGGGEVAASREDDGGDDARSINPSIPAPGADRRRKSTR